MVFSPDDDPGLSGWPVRVLFPSLPEITCKVDRNLRSTLRSPWLSNVVLFRRGEAGDFPRRPPFASMVSGTIKLGVREGKTLSL